MDAQLFNNERVETKNGVVWDREFSLIARMTQSTVRENCRSHWSLPPFVKPNSPAARFVQYVIRQSFDISKAAREGLRRGFTEASSHPLAVWLRLRCLGITKNIGSCGRTEHPGRAHNRSPLLVQRVLSFFFLLRKNNRFFERRIYYPSFSCFFNKVSFANHYSTATKHRCFLTG
jgi:hypothetical protein